jgi:murein L,D-transpeptidase YafK
MKTTVTLILVAILFWAFAFQADFLTEQKGFERVRTSIKEKQKSLENNLKENKLELDNFNLLIVAYKDDDKLELYAKQKQEISYRKILSYNVCLRSGKLGPKRKQGDYQVPEGFYHIDRFNPTSNFYLSLGLNYPNKSDRKKSKYSNLGGDIFIHGSCVTIGCLPMTDDKIKEIYLYAIHAKNNGQARIPVYIFPFKMTDQNMKNYKEKYNDNEELIRFWTNLKVGYDMFISDKKPLNISFADNGDYAY